MASIYYLVAWSGVAFLHQTESLKRYMVIAVGMDDGRDDLDGITRT